MAKYSHANTKIRFTYLELQGIVHLAKLLLPQPDVPASDVRSRMIHQFREFEQRHVSPSLGIFVFIDFPRPCFPH